MGRVQNLSGQDKCFNSKRLNDILLNIEAVSILKPPLIPRAKYRKF